MLITTHYNNAVNLDRVKGLGVVEVDLGMEAHLRETERAKAEKRARPKQPEPGSGGTAWRVVADDAASSGFTFFLAEYSSRDLASSAFSRLLGAVEAQRRVFRMPSEAELLRGLGMRCEAELPVETEPRVKNVPRGTDPLI